MAISTGSRYEQAERHFTFAHLYSERGFPLLEGDPGLVTLRIRTALRDTLYLLTTEPEPVGDVADYYARESENFPYLAYKILGDATRWWELAELNPRVWYPLDLAPGDLLKAPL